MIASLDTLQTAPRIWVDKTSDNNRMSMVVYSDQVVGAFRIATQAAASGMEVSMFFTCWGLKALEKPCGRTGRKGAGYLSELQAAAKKLGVKMTPCQDSMEKMAITRADLLEDACPPRNVNAFMKDAAGSKVTMLV